MKLTYNRLTVWYYRMARDNDPDWDLCRTQRKRKPSQQ